MNNLQTKSKEGLFKSVKCGGEQYSAAPPTTVFEGLVDKVGYDAAKMIYWHLADCVEQEAKLDVPYQDVTVNVEWADFEQTDDARASIDCPYTSKQYHNIVYSKSAVDKIMDCIINNLRRERKKRASQSLRELAHVFHRVGGDEKHRDWKHSFRRDVAALEEGRKKKKS